MDQWFVEQRTQNLEEKDQENYRSTDDLKKLEIVVNKSLKQQVTRYKSQYLLDEEAIT